MSENKIRVEEAINYHNSNKPVSKPKLLKRDLGKELFKSAKPATIKVNTSNLITGKTSRISLKLVKIICDMTGVDANFLFNIKPMKRK